MRITYILPLLAVAVAACGSEDSTGPSPTYASIAGSYAGPFDAVVGAIQIDNELAVTLDQSGPTLSGDYTISGTLTNGGTTISIVGTGTVEGTIASGTNPAVNLRVTPADCPNRPTSFSGTYDSANHRVTLVGAVQYFDIVCNVALETQAQILLLPD